jgi:4-methyl-5(b-hydroxyethyl)-thiazole monophosphate biosynthesis
MHKKGIVLLAEGCEEVEAITPIDYLRRAGIKVTCAAVGSNAGEKSFMVIGSHNIPVIADNSLEGLSEEEKLIPSEWDAVITPGGLPGADNLAASNKAGAFLKAMAEAGKWVCSICASPARVLSPLGLLAGKKFTCFPGEEEKVSAPDTASPGAEWKQDRVVVDGNILTSRGAGTAGEFACAIISVLVNEEEANNLAERVLLKG